MVTKSSLRLWMKDQQHQSHIKHVCTPQIGIYLKHFFAISFWSGVALLGSHVSLPDWLLKIQMGFWGTNRSLTERKGKRGLMRRSRFSGSQRGWWVSCSWAAQRAWGDGLREQRSWGCRGDRGDISVTCWGGEQGDGWGWLLGGKGVFLRGAEKKRKKGSSVGLLEGEVWRKGEKLWFEKRPLGYEHSVFFFHFFSYFLLCLHSLLFQAHIRCLNVGIIGHMFIAIISLDCCALPRWNMLLFL